MAFVRTRGRRLMVGTNFLSSLNLLKEGEKKERKGGKRR